MYEIWFVGKGQHLLKYHTTVFIYNMIKEQLWIDSGTVKLYSCRYDQMHRLYTIIATASWSSTKVRYSLTCLGVFDGYFCAERDYRLIIHTVNWCLSFETWTSFVELTPDGKTFNCDDITLMLNTFKDLGITRSGNENFSDWILSRKYLVSGGSIDYCHFE